MSDIIRLLPDSVANQIAAGEVIQRPASVVKELVENAVDAGARSIKIIVRDAGRTLLQVVDDGSGMSDTDARMAFERHATSKIEAAADLFSLHTMGFRGEALASIAAVAQVDLRTMRHGEELGTRLIINGSRVESQTPEACAPGTNMMVKNLFYNVPARRKFLKKDVVEMANILREFERMALVNTDIDFELIHNDVTVHKLMRSSLKQRIADLFGRGLDKQLLPVGTDTSIVRIDGFIGRPENARRRNALQFLTVNGRHMRHPVFHKALMQCYEELIRPDEMPNYFINFTVDPSTIDVNIHPTKNEIKFENEGAIRQILVAAVKEALGSFNAAPAIDFDAPGGDFDMPVFNPQSDVAPRVPIDHDYNPFRASSSPAVGHTRRSALNDWEKLYDNFANRRDESYAEVQAGQTAAAVSQPELPELDAPATLDYSAGEGETADFGSLQLKRRFIVTPSKSGLMVVEQHRAHERILYERFCEKMRGGDISGQKVMFAETLHLSASQHAVLESLAGELRHLGFELVHLGETSWGIDAVPAVATDINPRETLMRIVEEASQDCGAEALRRNVAQSLAASAAIPAGKELTAAEREHLLEELFRLPAPNYTSDGRLIVSIIPLDRITSLF